MPKFHVVMTDTRIVEVTVDADSEDTAGDVARQAYNFGDIEHTDIDGWITVDTVKLAV